MVAAPTPRIPPELIEEFSRGNGSIFIGAGVSMAAGLPSWAKLIEDLAKDITGCPSLKYTPFTDIAQYYETEHKRPFLLTRLRAWLSQPRIMPDAHRLLAGLPIRRYFTTNFDQLLETALSQCEREPKVIMHPKEIPYLDEGAVHVVKLHGDIKDPDSIVLTAEDYESYFSHRSALADSLRYELQRRIMLFIGYSFNDDHLRRILTRVKQELGRNARNVFTVQLNPPYAKVRDLEERRGMTVIRLKSRRGTDGDSHALNAWLQELSEAVHRRRRSTLTGGASNVPQLITVAEGFLNHNIKAKPGGLVGRKAYFQRTLEGLTKRYSLIAIEGPPGIGKTKLAEELGLACALGLGDALPSTAKFEYVVWVTAKENPEQKKWLNEVLNRIAKVTYHDAIAQEPASRLERKKDAVDRVLRRHKTLLIIDNYETIDDPQLTAWLESIPEPSKALITTRKMKSEGAWMVRLRGLKPINGAELLRLFAEEADLNTFIPDEVLSRLSIAIGGYPQAMRLALGLVKRGIDVERIIDHFSGSLPNQRVGERFEELFTWSWKLLSEEAKQIMLVIPLFVGTGSIREEALKATSGLLETEFGSGLAQCIDMSLLETLGQGQLAMHLMTRAFARSRLTLQPELEAEARRRFNEYYLRFAEKRVRRPAPKAPYWDALVSEKMIEIDSEWPSLKELLKWACDGGPERDELLVKLVMLLVHYMDSRIYNSERLEYVRRAVDVLDATGRKAEQALLRIDALGWTYVEEYNLEEARNQILAGLRLIPTLDKEEGQDLCALGLAWRARIEIERDERRNWKKASRLIEKARCIRDRPPWIKFRVYMASGDIELKQANHERALDYYVHAAQEADSYGGEIYQISPRIGLAHLGLGQLDEAEREFQEMMRNFEQIAIGRLYAEYGLALVAYERGDTENAVRLFEEVEAELSRRTKSNLLLRLIQSQKRRAPLEAPCPESQTSLLNSSIARTTVG